MDGLLCGMFSFLFAGLMIWMGIKFYQTNKLESNQSSPRGNSDQNALRDMVMIDMMLRGEDFIHSTDYLDEMAALSVFQDLSSETLTEEDYQDYDEY